MFVLGMKRRALYIVLLLFCALQVKAQTYHVGDIITNTDGSKGVVFYIKPDQTGGWMVALQDVTKNDVSKFSWAQTNVTMPPVSPVENNYYLIQTQNTMPGYDQTQMIRIYQSDHNVAAWVVDFDHGWYLPSARELQFLFSSLPLIEPAIINAGGLPLSDDYYWSSTKKDNSNAWTVGFKETDGNWGGGGFYYYEITTNHRVRAIRNFTMEPSSGDFSYLWNTGETTQNIIVNPIETTTYSVTVSTGPGCDTTESVTITVLPKIYYEFSDVACDEYTWNGITYEDSGDYEQTFTSEVT